jgi:hypothetical protein
VSPSRHIPGSVLQFTDDIPGGGQLTPPSSDFLIRYSHLLSTFSEKPMATRAQCKQFITRYLAEHFSVPPDWIKESTDLRAELLYENYSLVELGRWINQANWHSAYVLPGEIAACETVKDLIDLIAQKARD